MLEQPFEAKHNTNVGPCLFGVPVPVRALGIGAGSYRRWERSVPSCPEQTVIDLTGSSDTTDLMQADLWSAGARVVQLKRSAHKTIASEVAAA
jgi:hypothetical protein